MPCRIVTPVGDGSIIRKTVPINSPTKLPLLVNYLEDESLLDKYLKELDLTARENYMIKQQYYEYFVWSYSEDKYKDILAPIIFAADYINSPPALYFPKFTPLADDEEIWHWNNNQSIAILGMRSAYLGVSEEDILKFFDTVYSLTIAFELVEEDIIFNPSNVGFHPHYGLRLIDYGLKSDVF